LSVLPLDEDVKQPAMRSCNTNHPDKRDPIHVDMDSLLGNEISSDQIEIASGSKFYDRVKNCYAIVATSEPELFANVILRKGVIAPE